MIIILFIICTAVLWMDLYFPNHYIKSEETNED